MLSRYVGVAMSKDEYGHTEKHLAGIEPDKGELSKLLKGQVQLVNWEKLTAQRMLKGHSYVDVSQLTQEMRYKNKEMFAEMKVVGTNVLAALGRGGPAAKGSFARLMDDVTASYKAIQGRSLENQANALIGAGHGLLTRVDTALRDADRVYLRRLTALPEEGVGRVQEFVPDNSQYFSQKEKASAARQRELQEFDEKPFSGDFIGSAAFAGNAPQALMAAGFGVGGSGASVSLLPEGSLAIALPPSWHSYK